MKNHKSTLLFLFFIVNLSFSQITELSILTIPDSLTKNTNSVVRSYDTQIELVSHKKMLIHVKKTVTVLNKLGDHESKFTIHYDKNRKINALKVIAYDALGIELKKISKSKFEDYAAADGISLHNDGRIKYYKHVPVSYPYTIYCEYEIETSNTAFIPRWMPFDSYNQSVQNSSYSITHSDNLTLKYNEKQFSNFNVKKETPGSTIRFSLVNQPSLKYEEYSPQFLDIFPSAKFASDKFYLEGYEGSASNWQDFGKWMYSNLIDGRGEISEATKSKIKALVDNVEDPIEKARLIYDYVQKKTRYISVQVGIGGWMPMLANDVDRLAYGDCKALTNYTKVLLDVAGVKSYYTAVHAGSSKRDMENDVVSVQGNHVFLYIPSNEKDYWLECTSQTTPFGYQGSFTDDRDVLIISPEGGKIVHTPTYDVEKYSQLTTASYSINNVGMLSASVGIESSGLQYKDHYHLEKKSKKDIDDYYKSTYWDHLNNIKLLKTEFSNNKKDIVFTENVELEAANYGSFSGNRMLLIVNPFNRYETIPKRYRNRRYPLHISRGFNDRDEYTFNLPEGYTIEALPENINIKNTFGSYSFSIEKLNGTKLKYTRDLLIKKGEHPKEDYDTFRKFIRKISKYDNAKLILIKN